ncbi:endonuclease domain-containing protein [Phyllobacterium sp. K27]
MRRDPTLAENLLWQAVRNGRLGGLKFKRQVPILEYIVDFACLRSLLIVELDGAQHSGSVADIKRDHALDLAGFKTLRFWNDDVLDNLDGVCSQILHEANLRHT